MWDRAWTQKSRSRGGLSNGVKRCLPPAPSRSNADSSDGAAAILSPQTDFMKEHFKKRTNSQPETWRNQRSRPPRYPFVQREESRSDKDSEGDREVEEWLERWGRGGSRITSLILDNKVCSRFVQELQTSSALRGGEEPASTPPPH